MLMPLNECGVPKLVCCTLRPCQLPYAELYDLEGGCTRVHEAAARNPHSHPRPGPAGAV
jgi:hypothetical protein